MYIIKVDGMTVRLCRSFHEAKRVAVMLKGKVYTFTKAKLPKATTLSYNDPMYVKKEVNREIYSEHNHGYHYTKGRW